MEQPNANALRTQYHALCVEMAELETHAAFSAEWRRRLSLTWTKLRLRWNAADTAVREGLCEPSAESASAWLAGKEE